MKICYYELLEISRDASAEEIRRAYRRHALLLHPDKNIDRIEEATQKFAQIQSAYEILSDPDERAWYDSHRDQILSDERPRGSGGFANSSGYSQMGTTAEELLSFFDPSLFAIIDDSEIGFYTVASKVFKQLADEEGQADEGASDTVHLPTFGNSRSSWTDEVKYFYGTWSTFSTRKSFAWCDQYRLSDAPDRRVRRAMEKENKKMRDIAKKEYNDAVKAFVAFIKKRDPRAKLGTAQDEQRKQDLAAKVKEQAARARAAHRQQFQEYQNPDWMTPLNHEDDFWEEEYGDKKKRLKKGLLSSKAKQDIPEDDDEGDENFDENSEDHEERNEDSIIDRSQNDSQIRTFESDDDYDDDDIIIYECVVCSKNFKSEKQLDAHEKSKKHIKAVKDLVRKMRKEDKVMNLNKSMDGLNIEE
ncbi:hypothetical protein V1511DRAFT_498935 [Dipodascopsis uninucleata]